MPAPIPTLETDKNGSPKVALTDFAASTVTTQVPKPEHPEPLLISKWCSLLGLLEALSNSFPGVEKSYALQAGREIRVFVTPEKVSDLEAHKMAREIADRIQTELKYPGEIKVLIIRETRAVEYAR